ncbi:MAG: hypothetical protein HY744_25805 [Deltaproteobacteria bacterium]|nr:hypothetical protein [Deltaproteobacteria bacterium]
MTRAPVLAAPAPGAAGEPNPPTPPAAVSAGSSGAALPFHEAHWQGLELVPNTPLLARSLGLPAGAQGVIVDEATMPSDGAGFQAGDLVTAVGSVPTPDLAAFIRATERVRHRRRAAVQILRGATAFDLVLTAMRERLGTANGETAQTIAPASRAPHGYQGPCTDCHRIGTKGQLPADQGDLLDRTAPLIPAGRAAPHEDRGPCTACHAIRSQTRGEVPP